MESATNDQRREIGSPPEALQSKRHLAQQGQSGPKENIDPLHWTSVDIVGGKSRSIES